MDWFVGFSLCFKVGYFIACFVAEYFITKNFSIAVVVIPVLVLSL